MKLIELKEPKLEFANGNTHICPRHGIAEYSVFDANLETRPDKIVAGVVGTDDGIRKFQGFINWTQSAVPTESSNNRLHPSFCGMSKLTGYRTQLTTGPDVHQIIPGSEIRIIKGVKRFTERVASAVNLYLERIDYICSYKRPDVVVCVLPEDLHEKIRHGLDDESSEDKLEAEYKTSTRHANFRGMLKARCLRYGVPIQIVRTESLLEEASRMQIAATRAWNLCTALYFKSNISPPWKLSADAPSYPTCYVGIAFFKSADASSIDASTAQIFDELGKSVILRGRPASVAKEDRAPYLQESDAFELLRDALKTYRTAIRNTPSRLVIHKTSRFLPDEIAGFQAAADEDKIDMLDLVSVTGTSMKIYRETLYPPLRGSMLQLSSNNAILYSRGSVPFFRTYPGPRVPQPLHIEIFSSDRSLETVCQEVLGLTKMNWNNTQFDNKNPITLGCARRVGEVIKYLGESEIPQPSYAYYM